LQASVCLGLLAGRDAVGSPGGEPQRDIPRRPGHVARRPFVAADYAAEVGARPAAVPALRRDGASGQGRGGPVQGGLGRAEVPDSRPPPPGGPSLPGGLGEALRRRPRLAGRPEGEVSPTRPISDEATEPMSATTRVLAAAGALLLAECARAAEPVRL